MINNCLKKCNAIGNKITNLLKKEFDTELVHDNKYIKAKIKIYNNKIDTNFHGNKIPEDDECCTCLSVISLDSLVNVDKKYKMQIWSKKKKRINSLNEELKLDESDDESDDDEFNESNKE